MGLIQRISALRSRVRPRRPNRTRVQPECVPLEGRQLLSAMRGGAGAGAAVRQEMAQLNRAYRRFVADLRPAFALSQVTRNQADALTRDEQPLLTKIDQVVSQSSRLTASPQPTLQQLNESLALLNGDIGLAVITGWQSDSSWAQGSVQQVLRQDLTGFGYTQVQTDQFAADVRAFAVADGVSPPQYSRLVADMQSFDQAQAALAAAGRFASPTIDPMYYLNSHLTSFLRRR